MSQPSESRVVLDSVLLPNSSRFGTTYLLHLTREEYNKAGDVVWASHVFGIPSPKWLWNWFVHTGRRRGVAL